MIANSVKKHQATKKTQGKMPRFEYSPLELNWMRTNYPETRYPVARLHAQWVVAHREGRLPFGPPSEKTLPGRVFLKGKKGKSAVKVLKKA